MHAETLEQLIDLVRKFRIESARAKIFSKAMKIDHQSRRMRVAYTNAKIKQRQQVTNQIKAKRK